MFDIEKTAPDLHLQDTELVEVPERCGSCAFQDDCYPIFEPDGTCWREL